MREYIILGIPRIGRFIRAGTGPGRPGPGVEPAPDRFPIPHPPNPPKTNGTGSGGPILEPIAGRGGPTRSCLYEELFEVFLLREMLNLRIKGFPMYLKWNTLRERSRMRSFEMLSEY
ncbi:hypothetical protein H5410_005738 [Solanum commersonii]|uniref:Uncharacterized protein n=1 Tax=Solanum commersonii TaxID=4109 RepID=A0A9J6A7Z2_SOLCO|nr:hypothetical protein H5410_005738 [Solanum commersonii]